MAEKIERVFKVNFEDEEVRDRAAWDMIREIDIEPIEDSFDPCLWVSTFGRSAERRMREIVRRHHGRIE